MKHYVGIDLGTTNSAICSYDGDETRIWKSPEQNDVTPSVIFIDRRGNKFVGRRAYDNAPHSPENAAQLFKRFMGTSTPVELAAVDVTMTPEECSAEILRTLFGYLPEEVREAPDVGTVITVPAAFNQMQKNATMEAAEQAGIGRVALMQEPVAAVMSVMRARGTDGSFVVFDMGGGTLDVAIAESMGGKINLLAHGGIAMCGGRDFDRSIVDQVIKPWLHENFDLPTNPAEDPDYKRLLRLSAWAAERAKIELSSREETTIGLSEVDTRVRDSAGNEVYLDIPFARAQLDKLIEGRVSEAIEVARETLRKVGLTAHDLERVVFVGGPTNYKPLRDKVAFELGVPGSSDVNPMTAVAEGAALFAEAIDWGSERRERKSSRGSVSATGPVKVNFNYVARTPDAKARIAAQVEGEAPSGTEFQIDSVDTGWTSGRIALKHGAMVELALSKSGDNTFKIHLFGASGGATQLEEDRIVITRTAATVEAIPASHSIGVEVLSRLGGTPEIEWLIRAGDHLPCKGSKRFKAGESLKAGSDGSLNFRLLEGESEEPSNNRFIGMMKVKGTDLEQGVIPAGAELICDYEMLDSGGLVLEVSIPQVGATIGSGRNFYSRQEGDIDFSRDKERVAEESEHTAGALDEISEKVDDPRLEQARKKLAQAEQLDDDDGDAERAQEAMEGVLAARRLLADVRKDHLKEIRELELEKTVSFFDSYLREHARPSEVTSFENLVRTARRSIDQRGREFESQLDELKGRNFELLWRQDWFVVETFRRMEATPHRFIDASRHADLVAQGKAALERDEIDALRAVVAQLWQLQYDAGSDMDMLDVANIVRA